MTLLQDAWPATRRWRWCAAALAALTLMACGGRHGDKNATQVAAKVNKEEISVHQINFALQRQPGLKPEQAEQAGRQVLERLIDQELAVQKAMELKVDRDPRVMQAIEGARRDILARAYGERVAEASARPTAEEVQKYYDDNPALFRDRRVYNFEEIMVAADAAQVRAVQERMKASKSLKEVLEWMASQKMPTRAAQTTTAAEALPMGLLPRIAALKDGQALVLPAPQGLRIIALQSSRSEPVDLDRARPAIEQYLSAEHKRQSVEADLKSLRQTAHIEYLGKYEQTAARATALKPVSLEASAPADAASGVGADTLSKGLAGLR